MLDTLERLEAIDEHPAQDHGLKLDERKAWRESIIELRRFWDGKARTYQLAYEGKTYDVAVYSLDRRDNETEIEIWYFAEDEDGHTVAMPSPVSRNGHTRITVRNRLVEPDEAEGLAQEQLAAWIEHMKPIRILQDGDIITRDDIRAEMSRLLQSPAYQGQTWHQFADRGGITDEEIKEQVAIKFGSSGSSSAETISVNREASGFRLYMSWTKYYYNTEPILKGQATLDLAREILRTEHGLGNPDVAQMALF